MDLREVRFKRKIPQWRLSLVSGVCQSRISQIENGYPPSEAERKRIISALNVNDDTIEWPGDDED